MATRWTPPHFRCPEKRDEAWDLVVKVKYNGSMKRFNAHVNGSQLDHNLTTLRSKVTTAFKFHSAVEFVMTYTDEDEDVVMLDDINDLHDAVINQKLNPLRINVQLKNSDTEAQKKKYQVSKSRSPSPTALDDQLAQVKSAIDEAMKFVPEQVPAVLAKLSHDFRSRAASSVPSWAELLDRLAILMTPKGNMQTSSGPVYGSSCSSSGGTQASRNSKIQHDNELMTGSASQSPDKQNAPGLKSILRPEDSKGQVEQAPVFHSIDSLNFTSSGGKKSDHEGTTVTESKVRCASWSKGKSTTSFSVPPVSSSTVAPTPIQRTPAPSVGENKPRYWPTYGHNGLVSGGLQSIGGPQVVSPYYRLLGYSGNINKDWQPPSAPPPTDMRSPSMLDTPSSVGTYVPSKDGLYPFSSSYKCDVPTSCTNNLEGRHSFGRSYNYGSIPQLVLHKWIQCDGCGVKPIVGPRYKSNVKDDYDLCGACFSHMGNEFEYTRLDKPASVNDWKFGSPQGAEMKLECSFISDVTIPDGTLMAPSNLFTKIWHLRNSGCAVWPFGTQVTWVGGDQFAVQGSVKLGISVNGVAGGQEVDVAVDFLSPVKPGSYISYWRLALPSGKKFGQQIWVHIQVEEPNQTSGNKLSAAINLNLPPATNGTTLKSFTDMNTGSMNPFFQYPFNIYNETPPHYHDSAIHLESESEPNSSTAPNFHFSGEMFPPRKPVIPKESEPASSTLPSIHVAVKQGQIPTTERQASFSGSALTSISAAVPAHETISLPKFVSFAVPAPAPSVPALASLPARYPASVPTTISPDETDKHKEELLSELEEMGFWISDLNKEILRLNNYDMQQTILDLCCLDDRDPLHGQLPELGFNDAEMNKEAVAEGSGGSMKGLVMNLGQGEGHQ